MKKGFIDRTPLRFIGGFFILIVGLLARSLPITFLGLFDLGISFLFFFKPSIDDKKSFKFIIGVLYGAILLWSIFWLGSKF